MRLIQWFREAGPLVQASARRQFLFLFDLTFSTPTGIMRARDAALQLVREKLLPSDLAAVATYSQRGIQILVTFTPDHAQLERAITTLGVTETQPPARDVLSIAYDLGVARWGQGIGPPPSDDVSQQLIEMSRLMARGDQAYYKLRVDGFLDGLEQLVRTLDAVQGRKQVVLLSAGFDSSVHRRRARPGIRGGLGGRRRRPRLGGAERPLLRRLARARRARQRVQGGRRHGHRDPHRRRHRHERGRRRRQALPQPIGRGRDTLAQFAVNTGGRFVADANDLPAASRRCSTRSRRYYVLAFEPLDPKGKPDRLRKLKVRVRGDGLSVSHRRGYVIADPKREAARPRRRSRAPKPSPRDCRAGRSRSTPSPCPTATPRAVSRCP